MRALAHFFDRLPVGFAWRNLRDSGWHIVGEIQASINAGRARVEWRAGEMWVLNA